MKSEKKRIFISDLPETLTKQELENNFSKYGQVYSVEIKERKELGPNNKSLFFAYINLTTDDKTLNQCFRDLSGTKWHGQYVQLQIARESFMERLKRERQEAEGGQKSSIVNSGKKEIAFRISVENKDDKVNNKVQVTKKYESSSESEIDTSESESDSKIKHVQGNTKNADSFRIVDTVDSEEPLDIIIKSNKSMLPIKGGLKIPSVGNMPIVKITKSKMKQNDSEANKKRLQSLKDMKKGYVTQKSLIKNALSYSSGKPSNKIIFDDNTNTEPNKNIKINGLKTNTLFANENSEDDSDFEANFDVKEQFQGKSGQKLLELQSRYKNDKRFALDERFIEEEKNSVKEISDTEGNLEAEKNEQLRILEEVLGKKVTPKQSARNDSAIRKTMLKFDPSQPEHSSLELKISEPEKKKKKKEKLKEEVSDSQRPEPEVSKEVFYKVPEKLRETFTEKPQFSLLSMFGRTEESEGERPQEETAKEIKRNTLLATQNPFKYDSSDEEDEIEDIPHKNTSSHISQSKNVEHAQTPARSSQSVFWTEPFFFKNDDFRLQEGLDFIEKIKTEDREFPKIRRQLKGIVKAKVRNNERKNKMFKKKLGGSKRRKHIRIKKALKR